MFRSLIPVLMIKERNIRARNITILGRCEASWGEPKRDMTISTRLSDSVFTETHGLENALKSEYEWKHVHMSIRQMGRYLK